MLYRAAPDAARILPATNVAAHAIAAHADARLMGGLSAVLGADSNRRRAEKLAEPIRLGAPGLTAITQYSTVLLVSTVHIDGRHTELRLTDAVA